MLDRVKMIMNNTDKTAQCLPHDGYCLCWVLSHGGPWFNSVNDPLLIEGTVLFSVVREVRRVLQA